jgi:hypothetical protein
LLLELWMPMKKLGVILFLAALAALLAAGCSEDDVKPVVTRLVASESCGVAPLAVEFRADAGGGARSGEPTGGNNFLKLRWDFGDGAVDPDGASVAYHTYALPDTYVVSVTAEDDAGNVSPPYATTVVVLGDTLAVTSYSTVNGEPGNVVNPCQPIRFGIRAHGCDFDPDTGYYERFLYTWRVVQPGGTVVYGGPNPTHSFPPTAEGEYTVSLRVEDPGRSLTRRLEFPVTVLHGNGTQIALSADWLDDAPVNTTIQIPTSSLPDTFVYALRLACTGPDPGFGVRVRGRLPINDQLRVVDQVIPAGDDFALTVVDSAGVQVRSFIWTVTQVDPGETRQAEIRLRLQSIQLGQSLDFFHRIHTYPCDGDTTNNRVRTRIQGIFGAAR